MFKIYFNEASLQKGNNGAITGQISINLNGYSFPEEKWNDFVVVVINWWLENIENVVSDSFVDKQFRFMEGSFYFVVKGKGNNLQITLHSDKAILKEGEISREMLSKEIRLVAAQVLDKCQNLKWGTREIEELRFNLLADLN